MRRSLAVASAAAVVCVAAGTPLRAQGSAVMTHSSCATALGGAGVADPCDDGSAILFNPAALAETPSLVTLGWTGITAGGDFTYDRTGEFIEREESTTSVPFAYAAYRFGERLAAGIGLFAPYGLGLDWPACTVEEINGGTCTGDNFEGRFVSYDTKLTNIYVQPTVAFQATPWLSVGAGADYVMAEIDINQRLDLAEQLVPPGPGIPAGFTFGNLGVRSGTDFADAHLNGTGSGLGFHLGAQARVAPWLSVGARYLSEVEIDYEGDAEFTQINTGVLLPTGAALDPQLAATRFGAGQALSAQTINTGLTLPSQIVVGVAVTPMERLRVVADYQWTGWSSFDEAPLDFEVLDDQTLVLDYQDTDTWRLGAEFGATDALSLRAGFIYNTAAEREFSVSPLLPEAERNYYSAGLGYRIGRGLGIDVGYQLVDQADRRGRVRGRAPNATEAELEARNIGVYGNDVHLVNVTLSYRFGGR
jgi:long-chain fatty acid transport protein